MFTLRGYNLRHFTNLWLFIPRGQQIHTRKYVVWKIFIGIYFNTHNLDSTHTTYTYQLHIAIKVARSHRDRDTPTINHAPHYSEHQAESTTEVTCLFNVCISVPLCIPGMHHHHILTIKICICRNSGTVNLITAHSVNTLVNGVICN